MAKKKTTRRKKKTTRTPTIDPNAIQLPSGNNVPPPNILSYSFCIYGEKSIGKSTLSAQFPDIVAHFMLEPGRVDLQSPLIPDPSRNEPPLTWARFKKYMGMLADNEKPGRIIIDSLDLLAQLCENHYAKMYRVTSLMDLKDHGRTWYKMKDEWDTLFTALLFQNWRFIFLSHARNRPKVIRGVSREEAKELIDEGLIPTEKQPTARPWSVDWIKIPAAYIFYYGWHGRERILHVRGHEEMLAACANSENHFIQPADCDHGGEQYDAIPMGSNATEAYENLLLGWDNTLEGYFLTEVD